MYTIWMIPSSSTKSSFFSCLGISFLSSSVRSTPFFAFLLGGIIDRINWVFFFKLLNERLCKKSKKLLIRKMTKRCNKPIYNNGRRKNTWERLNPKRKRRLQFDSSVKTLGETTVNYVCSVCRPSGWFRVFLRLLEFLSLQWILIFKKKYRKKGYRKEEIVSDNIGTTCFVLTC